MAVPLGTSRRSADQIESGHDMDFKAGSDLTRTTATSGNRKKRGVRWTLGILADGETDEVPGSVLLLSKLSEHNAPLGIRRNSASSSRSGYAQSERSEAMFGRHAAAQEKKRTKNGKIILEPQPEDSMNDPLNWSVIRRDLALFSLGFYCMVGGGMTPILAAGFSNVATTYHVTVPRVALTTGLYMMGLGVGGVIASPTAIAFGKRPVYLLTSLIFLLTSVWCALSPNYTSLVVARVFQGLAVSPVECLPSATIAEIFFLHERAYRLGIYTLLLLGGKNLIPLVSAAIIQGLGWRWVFWIVAITVGFCFFLLFFFVPETFWDRTPRPRRTPRRSSIRSLRRYSAAKEPLPEKLLSKDSQPDSDTEEEKPTNSERSQTKASDSLAQRRLRKKAHFSAMTNEAAATSERPSWPDFDPTAPIPPEADESMDQVAGLSPRAFHSESWKVVPRGGAPPTPIIHDITSSYYTGPAKDYFSLQQPAAIDDPEVARQVETVDITTAGRDESEEARKVETSDTAATAGSDLASSGNAKHYTELYRSQPLKSITQQLKPYSGRLNNANWFRVALRPFVLFAYPSILWSAAVYALSVGWLIILSESVSTIYRSKNTYNFSALSAGLIYIGPLIGGILGTVVAGKVSDIIVRFMSRRNGGIYEPEFRLVMAFPVAICTTIGLMGYGWSAQVRDGWIVPTVFFGIISFGCTLGSTTAITFAVDSYRQYAGEALVTLNFSKNIFDGLVFSLFFNNWLDADGSKKVFLVLGGIQMGVLLFTVPMYIYGKRARMWTVRKNPMGRF